MAYHPDLVSLLTVGRRHVDPGMGFPWVMERHELPPVVLSTGVVTACDPLVDGRPPPLPVTVPPGRYPLIAWVAAFDDASQEVERRVAALQLLVRDVPIVGWELATGGEDINALEGSAYTGFSVDSGCAALADVAALDALDQWEHTKVEETFAPANFPLWPVPGALDAITDTPTGANIVVVSSGWGDGVYPTFICHGAGGEFSGYVVDFLISPPLVMPSPGSVPHRRTCGPSRRTSRKPATGDGGRSPATTRP